MRTTSHLSNLNLDFSAGDAPSGIGLIQCFDISIDLAALDADDIDQNDAWPII